MSPENRGMDCAEFIEIVHDLDRAGTLASALREPALAHAESCDRCARLLTEAESLDFGLRALGAALVHEQTPPRIEAALLRELKRQSPAPIRRALWQLAAAAAAAILLFAGAALVRHYEANPMSAPSQGGRRTIRGRAGPVVVESLPAPTAGDADNAADDQDADDFIPLPYADDPSMIDGGAIVRVVLPPSALASFGVQSAEMSGAEQIPADILVNQDGTPEAIRLVAQADVNQ